MKRGRFGGAAEAFGGALPPPCLGPGPGYAHTFMKFGVLTVCVWRERDVEDGKPKRV